MPIDDGLLVRHCHCGQTLRLGPEFRGCAVACPACGDYVQDAPPIGSTPVEFDRPVPSPLDYDTIVREEAQGPPWRLALALLYPANAIAMATVVALLAVLPGLLLLTFGGAFPLAIVVVACLAIVVGHYVNVIDETGPEASDEMPTVARNVSIADDVLQPLARLLLAIGVSFAPVLALLVLTGWRPGVAMTALLLTPLAAVGVAAFPAVLLTIVCGGGGTLQNLHPVRLGRVVRSDATSYAIIAAGLVPAAVALHGVAGLLFAELAFDVLGRNPLTPIGPALPTRVLLALAFTTLLLGVYAAHLAAWWLGRHYRRYHETFGWLLQRHERDEPRNETGPAESRRGPLLRDAL